MTLMTVLRMMETGMYVYLGVLVRLAVNQAQGEAGKHIGIY